MSEDNTTTTTTEPNFSFVEFPCSHEVWGSRAWRVADGRWQKMCIDVAERYLVASKQAEEDGTDGQREIACPFYCCFSCLFLFFGYSFFLSRLAIALRLHIYYFLFSLSLHEQHS